MLLLAVGTFAYLWQSVTSAFANFRIDAEEQIFELTTQVRVRDADMALVEMRSFVREAIFNTTMSEFSTVGRLVTFEAPLTTTYTLDTSMGTWGLFHQSIEVTQQGTGTFSTDLSAIHPDNIIWDDYISTLTILVPEPQLEAIVIHAEETMFQTTQGWLRFGEITLTAEEANELLIATTHAMETMMYQQLTNARTSTEQAIESMVRMFLTPVIDRPFEVVVRLLA